MTLTTPAKKDCLRESGAFAWVVVIALGLMSAGTTGTYSIIAGSFVAPVCEDLGFDYTSFSFYFTAILLGLALGLPLLSRFIPKVIGKPWHICIELVLIAAGAAMAFCTEVWMFTVSAAVIGICFSFTTGVCMSDVIDQWFSKSSGLAIGLAWGVNSLCTLLLSPVVTLVIEQQGWRTGYIVLAAVSAAMILPASAFIIRLNPSDRNMLPYGETASETHESCSADEQEDCPFGHGTPRCRENAVFYSLRPFALRGAAHLLHEPAVSNLCKRGRFQSYRRKLNGLGSFTLRYLPKSLRGQNM